jgi:hypothetical protein
VVRQPRRRPRLGPGHKGTSRHDRKRGLKRGLGELPRGASQWPQKPCSRGHGERSDLASSRRRGRARSQDKSSISSPANAGLRQWRHGAPASSTMRR